MKLHYLAIFLVCLIILLSILDAPEYVRCTDLGICEFLDLQSYSINILKSDMISHIHYLAINNLFSQLELKNLIDRREFVQHIIFLSISAILQSFKVSCVLTESQDTVLPSNENNYPLFENKITAQNLKLVEISVILS